MSALDDLQKALNEFVADYAKDSSACQLLSYSNGVQEGKRVEIEARQLAEKRQFHTAAALDSCQLEVRELKETLQEFRGESIKNATMLGDLRRELTVVTGERDTVRRTVAQLGAEHTVQIADLKEEAAKDFAAKNREITFQRQGALVMEKVARDRLRDIQGLAIDYIELEKRYVAILKDLREMGERASGLTFSLVGVQNELQQAKIDRDAAVRQFEEGQHRVKRYATAHTAITDAKERAEADFKAATLLAEDRQTENELLRRELQDHAESVTSVFRRMANLRIANKELKTYAGVMETRLAAIITERDKGQLK